MRYRSSDPFFLYRWTSGLGSLRPDKHLLLQIGFAHQNFEGGGGVQDLGAVGGAGLLLQEGSQGGEDFGLGGPGGVAGERG
jgi:hypothetical protein